MKMIVVIFPLQSSYIDYINLLLRKWFYITWKQKEGLTSEWLRPYWIAMPPFLSPLHWKTILQLQSGEQTGLTVLKSIIREKASREHRDTSNELVFPDPGNLLSRSLEDIGAVTVELLSVIKTAANWDIQSRQQLLTAVPIKRTWGPQLAIRWRWGNSMMRQPRTTVKLSYTTQSWTKEVAAPMNSVLVRPLLESGDNPAPGPLTKFTKTKQARSMNRV